jgi:hypothetical protein
MSGNQNDFLARQLALLETEKQAALAKAYDVNAARQIGTDTELTGNALAQRERVNYGYPDINQMIDLNRQAGAGNTAGIEPPQYQQPQQQGGFSPEQLAAYQNQQAMMQSKNDKRTASYQASRDAKGLRSAFPFAKPAPAGQQPAQPAQQPQGTMRLASASTPVNAAKLQREQHLQAERNRAMYAQRAAAERPPAPPPPPRTATQVSPNQYLPAKPQIPIGPNLTSAYQSVGGIPGVPTSYNPFLGVNANLPQYPESRLPYAGVNRADGGQYSMQPSLLAQEHLLPEAELPQRLTKPIDLSGLPQYTLPWQRYRSQKYPFGDFGGQTVNDELLAEARRRMLAASGYGFGTGGR